MKQINTEKWNKAWTVFSFFTLGNQTYMYSYKKEIGTYDVSIINGVESKVSWSRLDRGEIQKGFTAAETFVEKGIPYVMMYDEVTGDASWFQLKIN